METYRHVLVGTDGSPIAARAIAMSALIASSLNTPLEIVGVWPGGGGGESTSDEYESARDATAKGASIAVNAGVAAPVTNEPSGDPAETLMRLAEGREDCLLVVGGRGLDSALERLGGNVAHELTHKSPTDLLVVHEHGPLQYASVALSTDGSTTATAAVRQGLALATELGAAARLLTVAKDDDEGKRAMSAVVNGLSLEGIDIETEVVIGGPGNPGKQLSEAAASYDMLVIGNRGLSGPARLLGSVSTRLTHEFPTDLLIVHTTD